MACRSISSVAVKTRNVDPSRVKISRAGSLPALSTRLRSPILMAVGITSLASTIPPRLDGLIIASRVGILGTVPDSGGHDSVYKRLHHAAVAARGKVAEATIIPGVTEVRG